MHQARISRRWENCEKLAREKAQIRKVINEEEIWHDWKTLTFMESTKGTSIPASCWWHYPPFVQTFPPPATISGTFRHPNIWPNFYQNLLCKVRNGPIPNFDKWTSNDNQYYSEHPQTTKKEDSPPFMIRLDTANCKPWIKILGANFQHIQIFDNTMCCASQFSWDVLGCSNAGHGCAGLSALLVPHPCIWAASVLRHRPLVRLCHGISIT